MNLEKSINMIMAINEVNQAELAKMTGITSPAISIIKRNNAISTKTLIKLADTFGISVSEFIALGECERMEKQCERNANA